MNVKHYSQGKIRIQKTNSVIKQLEQYVVTVVTGNTDRTLSTKQSILYAHDSTRQSENINIHLAWAALIFLLD